MTKTRINFFVLLVMMSLTIDSHSDEDLSNKSSIKTQLDDLLARSDIPALALGEFGCKKKNVVTSGLMKIGEPNMISLDNIFNIGSNAKAMLSTVAVRLDQQGKLNLDQGIAELWPDSINRSPEKGAITLRQLLSHTSGLPAFDTGTTLSKVPTEVIAGYSVSQSAALWFLQQELIATPGHQTVYSNAGYVVASALIERALEMRIEDIIQAELFEPLSLT